MLAQKPAEARLQRALDDAVFGADPSFWAACITPEQAALGKPALRAATKTVRDKRARDWVSERNAIHGASVSSASVLTRWNAATENPNALEENVAPVCQGNPDVTKRTWAFRGR